MNRIELETRAKRCLCCLVRFEVPFLKESENHIRLFYDAETKDYGFYSWEVDGENEAVIKTVLENNVELAIENDNTKGETALRLIGHLADGHFEPVINNYHCPNCGSTNQNCKSKGTKIMEVKRLTFVKCNQLGIDAQVELLEKEVH